MPPLYYYKDGDEEVKGPLEETAVLEQYRNAAFTSDVEFQIRSSESDNDAPFNKLYDLINENGHENPFRDENEELDAIIAEKMKELDELSIILEKGPAFEKKLNEATEKIKEIQRQRKETAGTSVNDGGITLRKQKHMEADEKRAFPDCSSCSLVFSSLKQLMMHTSRSSCKNKHDNDLLPDLPRWKKEDDQRLAAGQRLFKKMTPKDIGSARPQIDFVEELHARINAKMGFKTDHDGARTWIKTEEAKKVSDRFVKHLKDAKGNLVCTRCQVACRSHQHFLVHLITYDHRLKVKGFPIELLSLLVGSFHKEQYLNLPHPSELDEDLDVNGPSATPVPTKINPTNAPSSSVASGDRAISQLEPEEFTEEKNASLKTFYVMDWSQRKAMNCIHCGVFCSSYKQHLLHRTSEEHERVVSEFKAEPEDMEKCFGKELQQWRSEDRVKLVTGKRLFDSMSEDEIKNAAPSEQFIEELRGQLKEGVAKLKEEIDKNGLYGYLVVADYLTGDGASHMKSLEDHLKNAKVKKYVCRQCKVAFDSPDKYFVHCQMAKHLNTTPTKPDHYSSLIAMHKKDLYFN